MRFFRLTREMSGERMVERDEFGREIVYVSGKDIPNRFKWSKHINNLVERGEMENAMSAARDIA